VISRGRQQLLGQLLAHAGGARGLLRRPARRFLGLRPRRARGGGRGPVFCLRAKREVVHSNIYHFVLMFSEAIVSVFKYIFYIYSNLNQRDNLFREKSEFNQ
jgi:hypothetical protein